MMKALLPAVFAMILLAVYGLICYAAGSARRDALWQQALGPCSLPETRLEEVIIYVRDGQLTCRRMMR